MTNPKRLASLMLIALLVGSGYTSCPPRPATSVPETPLRVAARTSKELASTLNQLNKLVGQLHDQKLLSDDKTHKADLALLKAARDTKLFNANARTFTTFDAGNKKSLFDLGKQIADTIASILGLSDNPDYQTLSNLAKATIDTILALTQ